MDIITTAYAELATSIEQGEKDHRNAAIARLTGLGQTAKEIATAAGMHPDSVRRIAKNHVVPETPTWQQVTVEVVENVRAALEAEAVEMPTWQQMTAEEAEAELAALEAEAVASPATKAAAKKAAKAEAKKAAEEAAFEDAAPKLPGSAVVIGGEVYIAWTRKTREGEHLTVCNPEVIGADAEDGKWVTFCEEHKTFVHSKTQKQARALKGVEFCDDCKAAAKAKAKAEKAASRKAAV